MDYRVFIVLTLLLITGCAREEWIENINDNEEIEVTLSLNLPSNLYSPASATTAARTELLTNELEVIIFEKKNNGYVFGGFATPQKVNSNVAPGSFYKVMLQKNSASIHLMLLGHANARNYASGKRWVAGSTPKEQICKDLEYTLSSGIHTDEATIPLWGETKDFVASPNYNTLNEVTLLRMFSAIQVVVSEEIPKEEFELTGVYLYNGYYKGLLIPGNNNFDQENSKVTAVTLPENAVPVRRLTLGEDLSDNRLDPVYVCESWPFEAVDRDNVPFLIIAGKFHEESKITYYRVDLFNENENGEKSYRPLLRNRFSRINITAIGNRGEEDEEEAIKKDKAELDVHIPEWDLQESGINLYGYNILSVSRNDILLSGEANNLVQVTVYTDHHAGWAAKVKEGGTWLKIEFPDPATGEANVYTSLGFSVDENLSGNSREGEILIEVGSAISYILYIKQELDYLELSVTDDSNTKVHELIFGSNHSKLEVDPQQLNIQWGPGEVCFIAMNEGQNPFVFDTAYHHPDAAGEWAALEQQGGIGNRTLTIRPVPFTREEITENPFIERTTTLDFIVSTESSYKKHSVVLRHINYHLELSERASIYRIGEEYIVDVVTNADDWDITKVDHQGVFESLTKDKSNNTVIVKMSADPTKFDWVGGFMATSVKAAPVGQLVNRHAYKVFPNSFIAKPGENLTIQIANIQAIWREWLGREIINSRVNNDFKTFTFEVFWKSANTDMVTITPSALSTAAIGNATNLSDYRNATFNVQTGNTEGNVVIVAKVDNEIVWNWHIWITNYDPEIDNVTYNHSGNISTTFMDRNLGASNNTQGNIGSVGCYYQWGRKDPFPGPRSYTQGNENNNIRDTFDKDGNPLTNATPVQVSDSPATNLRQAITNPFVFISSSEGMQDWYCTNETDKNDYLWTDDEGYKTAFDPCPEGWRVPHMTHNRSPWFNISPVSYSNYGYNWRGEVGHFSTCGFKRPQDGFFNSLSFLHTWMSDTSGNMAYGFRAANNVYGNNVYERASGRTVRCIKDKN